MTWSGQRIDALIAWAQAELAVDNAVAVADVLPAEVDAHPLAEPLVAVLARAYAVLGSPADALMLIDRTQRHLAEQLGIGPGDELRDVHKNLLAADRLRFRPTVRIEPRSDPCSGRPHGRLPGRDADLRLLDQDVHDATG